MISRQPSSTGTALAFAVPAAIHEFRAVPAGTVRRTR